MINSNNTIWTNFVYKNEMKNPSILNYSQISWLNFLIPFTLNYFPEF